MLDGLLRRSGHPGPVRLSVSPRLQVPAALPGGEICLPEEMAARVPSPRLRAILAHELGHVVGRDVRTLTLVSLLTRILSVQPLLRVARGRLQETAELRSDDWVRDLGFGRSLAEALMASARRLRGVHLRPDVAGLAHGGGLEARIRRLLGLSRTDASASREWRVGVLPLALAMSVFLVAATPGLRIGSPGHAITSSSDPAGSTGTAPPSVALASGLEGVSGVAGLLGRNSRESRESLVRLVGKPGGTLLLRIDGQAGAASLTLRPGEGPPLLSTPGGEIRRLPVPGDRSEGRGWVTAVRLSDPAQGRYELHLPPSVRRLALRVAGQGVEDGASLLGDELPSLVPFP